MKVAFYTDSFDPSRGGMERVTYILTKYLAAKGVEVYGICVYSLPSDKSLYGHYIKVIQADGNMRSVYIPAIIEFLKINKINVFVNQVFVSFTTIGLQEAIKKETTVKLVNAKHINTRLLDNIKTFHRSIPIPSILNKMAFSIYKNIVLKPKYVKGDQRAYLLADATILLSESEKQVYLKYNKLRENKPIYIINNPSWVDSLKYLPEKKNVMLVVCRMDNTQKRIDRVLRFWKRYQHCYPTWCLKIVGDGKDLQLLEKLACKLELTNYSFEGASSDPMNYYKEAKIFLMTSDFEGWGMTLVEAMTFGCVPVAMNTYSAVEEVIKNRKNGIIIPPDDYVSMKNAVDEIINKFDHYSNEAMLDINRFSIDIIGNKWLSLFRGLINE